MAFSKTKIFNIALSNLGVSAPLQNSMEESPTAILMNNYYELAITLSIVKILVQKVGLNG